MSILASLAKAYERLNENHDAPDFGYSRIRVGFCIVIKADGAIAFDPIDLRQPDGKNMIGPRRDLPSPLIQRTSGISSNFLWDKTAYSLGVTSDAKARTAKEHGEFIKFHRDVLKDTKDEGHSAFLKFIDQWDPNYFHSAGWPEDMKDENIIFALEGDHKRKFLHERPASIKLWRDLMVSDSATNATCLVKGTNDRIARSHPPIKGVKDAQSSGAFIVSFNDDAYTSYGHAQGDNAPISEVAAFAYTTALNRFLEKDSKNRVQLGDASTVFWADASSAEVADEAESLFGSWIDESMQSDKVGSLLAKMRSGQAIKSFAPELADGVRFYVLGLAPNAARISIRFYFESDFGTLAANYQRFVQDMRIEPEPREGFPPLWKYLCETAVLGKSANVPPKLVGDWMRAILTGGPYPLTLMSSVQMRIRADKDINALRIAMLKAVLIRNYKMEVPVALDTANRNKGYLLGRLFSAYEQAQRAALGDKVNATIKDKFYGTASAQPRRVFALLDKGSVNHLSKLGKAKPGYRVVIEREIADIMAIMQPGEDPFPASMSAEEQALFGVGYYHQRNQFFKPKSEETSATKDAK